MLFWPLLEPAGPIEVLMHRIIWSFALCVLIMTVLRYWRRLRGIGFRAWVFIALGGLLNACNWGLFIYSVLSEQVVAASMAYFLNPIASVTFGILILRERLRLTQAVALTAGVGAVVITGVAAGGNVWLPLLMATCFGCYALVQRVVRLGPIPTLTGESALLMPLALTVLISIQIIGEATFFEHGTSHIVLLILAGVVTLAPLLAFGYAARRTPLTLMAVMQYIAPIIQFVVGVFLMREPMPMSRWIGVVLVIVAVVIFTAGEIAAVRRRKLTSSNG